MGNNRIRTCARDRVSAYSKIMDTLKTLSWLTFDTIRFTLNTGISIFFIIVRSLTESMSNNNYVTFDKIGDLFDCYPHLIIDDLTVINKVIIDNLKRC